jgi:hypothetical protein
MLLKTVQEKQAVFFVGVSLKPTVETDDEILSHPDFIEINELVGSGLIEQVHETTFFVDDWLGAVQLPAYLTKRPLYLWRLAHVLFSITK